jgi:hypothetical protein
MNQPEDPHVDVDQLLRKAASRPELLARLDACVRDLQQAEAATCALAQVPAEQLREALERRHRRVTDKGEPA